MSRRRPPVRLAAAILSALVPVAGATAAVAERAPQAPAASAVDRRTAHVRADDGHPTGFATFRPARLVGAGSPDLGPASFVVTDLSCGDGVVVGLYYAVEGGPERRWEPPDDACPPDLPWRSDEVILGVRGDRPHVVRWWTYARDLGERDPRWGSDLRRDLTSIVAVPGNTRRSRRACALRAPVS